MVQKSSTCPICRTEFFHPHSAARIHCSRACAVRSRRNHGESGTRLYTAWKDMFVRCSLHKSYLALRIRVCEEWKDYLIFKTWALAHGYEDDLELDRKDGDLGYFPGNCRWVTEAQQSRNHKKRKKGVSNYRGVWPSSPGRWRAVSYMNRDKSRKQNYLGVFSSEEDAAKAYDDFVYSIDPEHATLNFPERKRQNLELIKIQKHAESLREMLHIQFLEVSVTKDTKWF